MNFNDTQRFVKLIEVQHEHQRLWLERYPKYCKTCNGWGRVQWTENQAPLGSGYVWHETFDDQCDKCIGDGCCPRCQEYNQTWDVDKPFHCQVCGWDEDQADGLPLVAEEITLEEPLDD